MSCELTDGDEVLLLSRLGRTERPVVEQQAVCRLSQELQGDVALEARHDGREPGVALTPEAVFGLLALRSVEHGGTLTSERREEFKNDSPADSHPESVSVYLYQQQLLRMQNIYIYSCLKHSFLSRQAYIN